MGGVELSSKNPIDKGLFIAKLKLYTKYDCLSEVKKTIIWWRWGELNPRPKTFSQEVYMLSTGLLI